MGHRAKGKITSRLIKNVFNSILERDLDSLQSAETRGLFNIQK